MVVVVGLETTGGKTRGEGRVDTKVAEDAGTKEGSVVAKLGGMKDSNDLVPATIVIGAVEGSVTEVTVDSIVEVGGVAILCIGIRAKGTACSVVVGG